MVEIILSEKAREVLSTLRKDRGRLYMLLGDTGCCGFSNVFITAMEPSGDYVGIGEVDEVKVYVQPSFMTSQKFYIDAVYTEADDSFSAETSLGCRLILRRR